MGAAWLNKVPWALLLDSGTEICWEKELITCIGALLNAAPFKSLEIWVLGLPRLSISWRTKLGLTVLFSLVLAPKFEVMLVTFVLKLQSLCVIVCSVLPHAVKLFYKLILAILIPIFYPWMNGYNHMTHLEQILYLWYVWGLL